MVNINIKETKRKKIKEKGILQAVRTAVHT